MISAIEHTVYRLVRQPGRFDLGRSFPVRLLVTAEKRGEVWAAHSVQTTGLAGASWSWSNDLREPERIAIEAALAEQLLKDAGSDIPKMARHAATLGELETVR